MRGCTLLCFGSAEGVWDAVMERGSVRVGTGVCLEGNGLGRLRLRK